MAECYKILWIGFGGFILLGLISFVLAGIFSGINVLQANEVGIEYRKWSKTIDDKKLFRQGTHFLGFFTKFYKFKTDITSINDKIDVRTKDGMRINIEISYQFTYIKEISELIKLIQMFKYEELDITLIRMQRDILRTISAEKEVEKFVFDRNEINASFNQGMKEYLSKFAISVLNFQVLNINYPENYNAAIVETQNQKFKINQEEINLKKVEEQLQGLIEKAKAEANVIRNDYKQKTFKETEKIYKNIEILKNYVKNIDGPLKEIKDITGEEKLPEYLLIEFLREIKNVGFYPYTPAKIREIYSN